MMDLEEIKTHIPFQVREEEAPSSQTDEALHKVFQDRLEIFSLLSESIEDVVNPQPSYVKSLRPYLSLPYTFDDMIAINSIVDGEINIDLPSGKSIDDMLLMNEKKKMKLQYALFHKYDVNCDEYFHKQHVSFVDKSVSEDEESGDESDMMEGRTTSERMRNAAVIATGVQKMSVEEFHQKITWERWSGNGGTLYREGNDDSTEELLHPHSHSAGGINISMPFKPPAWHNRDANIHKASPSRSTLERTSSGNHLEPVLSFNDFMRSIPMFHGLTAKELGFIEDNSHILSFEDQELIISEGQQADTVYVVREGVVKRVKAKSNPTTVRRGDIFGDSAVTGQVSQATYISSGSTLLVCIPPKIFNAILQSSESDFNISNTGVDLEDSILTNHIEKFLDILHLFSEDGEGNGNEDKNHQNSLRERLSQRASTFKLSKQSSKQNVKSPSVSSEPPSEVSETSSRPQSFRHAPRMSEVFSQRNASNESTSQSERPDDNSSEPSSSSDAVDEMELKSTKLDKPIVEPISVSE